MLTSDLVARVKLRGALPEGRFSDEEILEFAYDALLTDVVPLIVQMREEYYVRDSVVAAANTLNIPYRALGLVLRDVQMFQGTTRKLLYRINPQDVWFAEPAVPESFYLKANTIKLHPTLPSGNTDYTVSMSYFLRPSRLVLETLAAQITSIDRDTGIIVATTPATWSTANTFDLVSSSTGHDLVAMDLTAQTVSETEVTFDIASIPTELAIGDYICLAGESVYPTIPEEADNLIAQLTVCDCLAEMGASEELQVALAKADKLKMSLGALLSNRIQGKPKRLRTRLL